MRYLVTGQTALGTIGYPLAEADTVLRYVDELKQRKISEIKILDETGHAISEKNLRDEVNANRI